MKQKVSKKKVCLILLILISSVSLIYLKDFFLKNKPFLPSKPKYNLVLISIDTLRPDHTSVYGYPLETTPNLNKLSQTSYLFNNFRTNVPMTYPSFVSLMTGKSTIETRVFRNGDPPLSDNSKTLAYYLKNNGYKTAAFLTGALIPEKTNLSSPLEANYHAFKIWAYDSNHQNRVINIQSSRQDYEEYINQANDWIDQNKNQPFFLWLHLMDPHAPYQPPDELKCKFNSKYCNYISSRTPEELESERADYQRCQSFPPPEDKVELFKTLYDGGIAYSDKLVGLVIDHLKEKSLDENTVIVIFSDHGEGFDHNYYFDHREVLYDTALKTFLMIKLPQSKTKLTIKEPTQNTQVLPTILDVLSLNYDKKNFTSSSLISKMASKPFSMLGWPSSYSKKNSYYHNADLTKFAIFDGRYKYIYSLPQSCLLNNQLNELYDLSIDPQELSNLYNQEDKIARKLKDQLFSYLSSYNLPPKFDKPGAVKQKPALPY